MYVKMDKKGETDGDVEYLFSTTVPGEWYLNERGKKRREVIIKTGLCRFTKADQNLIFVEQETDEYFLNRTYEWVMMRGRLIRCQKEGSFPDIIDIATG